MRRLWRADLGHWAIFVLLATGALYVAILMATKGIELFHDNFQDWVIMILPSGGFFTLAGWLLAFNYLKQRRARADAAVREAA